MIKDAHQVTPQPVDEHGMPDWSGILDWGVGVPAAMRGSGLPYGSRPCSICGKPAICISPPTKARPFGQSVHKVCAEQVAPRPPAGLRFTRTAGLT